MDTTPETAQCITACRATSMAIPTWGTDINSSYEGDNECVKLLQEVTINPASNPHYTTQSGILRYKGRIYVGSITDLKQKIFNYFHASTFGGHSGIRVTYQKLKQIFYWPKMKQYLTEQIAACPTCQISETEKYPTL
jgi:hypothetical protein